jgi:hypothetical protein
MQTSFAAWLKSDSKQDLPSYAVAPGDDNFRNVNTLVGARVRMGALSFEPPRQATVNEFTGADPSVPSPADQLLAGLRIHVLEDAYLVLMQMATGKTWLRPNAKYAVAARTDKQGNLIAIKPEEFDAGVPSGKGAMLLDPIGRYAYFWTVDKKLAKEVWAAVQKSPEEAVRSHPFETFSLQREVRFNEEVEKLFPRESDPNLKLLAGHFLLGADMDGTMLGGKLQGFSARGTIAASARYVVARSQALETMYAVELVNRLAYQLRMKTEQNWDAIRSARDVASYATEKRRRPEFDRALPAFEYGGAIYRNEEVAEHYYEYAYSVARADPNKVPRPLFRQSLDQRVNEQTWRESALKILEATKAQPVPARHPSLELDEEGRTRWKPAPNQDAVIRYFDFYRFGFDAVGLLNERKILPQAERAIAKLCTSLAEELLELMKERAHYRRFVQELAAHLPDDPEMRTAMHAVYHRVTKSIGYLWWEHFDPERGWDLDPYVAWMATSTDKFGDVMGAIFGDPIEAIEANALIEAAGNRAEKYARFFWTMNAYDQRLGRLGSKAQSVELVVREGAKMKVDFAQGLITFSTKEAHPIGPLHFLLTEETRVVESGGTPIWPGQVVRYGQVAVKRYRDKVLVKELHVTDLPFKGVQKVPAWLGAFGDTLAAAAAIQKLSEELSSGKSKVLVLGEVTANTLQAVGSLADAIRLIQTAKNTLEGAKAAPRLLRIAGKLGVVGNLAEAVVNVGEGYYLVYGGKESEVEKALEKGDTVLADALRVKGWIQMSALAPAVAIPLAAAGEAAVGAGMLEGKLAAGVSAVSEPVLAASLVWLAVIAFFGLGFQSWMHSREDWMEEARRTLRSVLDDECGKQGEKSPYALTRTADDLDAFSNALTKAFTAAAIPYQGS